MLKDTESAAAALYDGGWRARDEAELMSEYEFSAEEAAKICKHLEVFESKPDYCVRDCVKYCSECSLSSYGLDCENNKIEE